MAQNILNLNFNLRSLKLNKQTPINLVIRFNNQKYTYPTSEKILPKNWQGDKTRKNYQRAKASTDFPEWNEFNARLQNIENNVHDVFRRYKNDNQNEVPNWSVFKSQLDVVFKRNVEPVKGFLPFIYSFIAEKRTNVITGKEISVHTIKKYKTTLAHLEAYIQKTGKKIDFENIDIEFYNSYKNFLNQEYNLAVNSIGKDIAVLRLFLNEATQRGLNKNLFHQSGKFKAVSEESDSIYLTENELKLLYDLDLSSNKTYEIVRDLFLIGCYTGLRYSDYNRLNKYTIIDNKIKIEAMKTQKEVVIPVHKTVKKIFEKYSYEFPKGLTNQKTNEYLKIIGSKVQELTNTVEKKITRGGVRTTLLMPKYQLITTHTARRSFATNLYLSKFPAIGIMKITGHRTESAFMRYIKITTDDNAVALEAHWEKNAK